MLRFAGILLWVGGCSDLDLATCDTTSTSLELSETSALGFTGDEVVQTVRLAPDWTIAWSEVNDIDPGEAPKVLTLTVTGLSATFEQPSSSDGACASTVDRVVVDVDWALAEPGGSFEMAGQGRLLAHGVSPEEIELDLLTETSVAEAPDGLVTAADGLAILDERDGTLVALRLAVSDLLEDPMIGTDALYSTPDASSMSAAAVWQSAQVTREEPPVVR
jgi:hypothetical protein